MAVFPLPIIPKRDFTKGGIRFGASRSGGSRRHAGCDLIVKKGTPVLAVEKGLVIQGPRHFYHGTYSVVVQHDNFIVRYCEVDKKVAPGIKKGASVAEGQTIAYVGKMYSSSMLHFEMYDGSETGYLTQTNSKMNYKNVPAKNYKRRADLLDSTPYLTTWKIWVKIGDFIEEMVDSVF